MRTIVAAISMIVLVGRWTPLLGQAAPTNFRASATGPTTVELTWAVAAGANGYVVQRGIGTSALERLTPTRLTDTKYTDAAAPAGSALRYRIRAVFASGQSSLSEIAAVTTPAAPSSTASAPPSTASAPEVQPAGQSMISPPPGQPTTSSSQAVVGTRATATTRAGARQAFEPAAGTEMSAGQPNVVGSKNPTNFVATVQGTQVVLTWNAAPGVSWYLIGGPTMGLYGKQVQGTSYTLGSLDPGGYEWTVASLEGEGRAPLTNWADWPKAQAVVSGNTAGSYRITVAGFRVTQNTYDDQLSRDGHGDEVYSSVVLQRFDRKSGRLIESNSVTSSVHGDGNQAPDRIPQGQATGNGGLTAGDVVPFGWDERTPQPALIPGRFPQIVWEGPLADGGDVLVLRPTLWEADGDRTAFDWWLRFLGGSAATDTTWKLPRLQQSLASSGIGIIPGIGKSLYPNDTRLLYASPDIVDQMAVGNSQPNYINPGRDRPIGLNHHEWDDELLVLDREKIEAELTRASQVAAPAGLISIPLDEEQGGSTPLGGHYLLYLRIERK